MTQAVAPAQRFGARNLCPICGGGSHLPPNHGQRCFGYKSFDGWLRCTREEYAGALPQEDDGTYAHKPDGECRCGKEHGAPTSQAQPAQKIQLHTKREVVKETVWQVGEFEHIRLDYNDGSKTYPWRPVGGTVKEGLKGTAVADLPLYGLERLSMIDEERTEPATVIVTEGERCSDALWAAGIIAVATVTGASGCPCAASLSALRGFDVVLWPDADPPDKFGAIAGQVHMNKVASALAELGIPCRILDWPDAPAKGDAADFFGPKYGGTAEGVAELVEEAVLFVAPVVAPPAESGKVHIWTADELMAHQFVPPKWAIQGILPAGLTIMAGRPKLGKSWLGLGWAIDLTAERLVLRSLGASYGDALYMALEDGPRRIQERLAMMLGEHGIPKRLHIVTEWPRTNEGGIDELDEFLEMHPDTRLVVIDTFKRVRPIEKNTARLYDNDYDAITPIAQLAQKRNVAIVCVFHTRKGESTDPLEMVSGTLGLTGAADAVMVLKRERGQADASLFITGRDVEEQDLALKWEAADDFGWRLLGNAENFRKSQERQQIIDVLARDPGIGPGDIAGALGKTTGTVRRLLWSMTQDEEVRNRDGKYWPNAPSVLIRPLSMSGNADPTGNTAPAPHKVMAPVAASGSQPALVTTAPTVTELPRGDALPLADISIRKCQNCGGDTAPGLFFCIDCQAQIVRMKAAAEESRNGMIH